MRVLSGLASGDKGRKRHRVGHLEKKKFKGLWKN